MAKVSIGLRGWRFDEEDVFDGDGNLRPLDRMPADVSDRVSRLSALVGAPCDACYLLQDDPDECEVASVVYGEPMAEVVLCRDHEADFLYWYREEGGERYRGTEELQDAFHEWFADGGRAPEGYAGLEHVDTAPEEVPTPEVQQFQSVDPPEGDRERIDLREVDDDAERLDPDEDLDVDLDTDYPT